MQQIYVPGTEPPGRDEEIERAIEAKYLADDEVKLAQERRRVHIAKLLELVKQRGAPYKFLEPGTGRKKTLKLDASEKLKTTADKPAKQGQADREWAAAQQEARGGDQQDAAREAWEQGVKAKRARKDPAAMEAYYADEARRAAESEARTALADDTDPFAATRAAMGDSTTDSAADETPAQRSARESQEARAARRTQRKATTATP